MTTKDSRKPLQTDQISKSDELDRERFAAEISDSILHHIESSNESMVIGIHGPWGSGKSNLLYFIKEKIKKSFLYTSTEKVRENFGTWEKWGLRRAAKSDQKKTIPPGVQSVDIFR